MMKMKAIAAALSLAAVAASAAVPLLGITPFAESFDAVVMVAQEAGVGAFVVQVQTSPDGVTWTTVATVNGVGPTTLAGITLDKYIRMYVSTAGTGGTVSAYLLA